jgi:hypothetical protein
MRWLEVRHHPVTRRSRGPGSHLSQEGVALARLVGGSLGSFASVVTRASPRAIGTALAESGNLSGGDFLRAAGHADVLTTSTARRTQDAQIHTPGPATSCPASEPGRPQNEQAS